MAMQIDLESISVTSTVPYRSQVCVLGGGIAGLVLATALAKVGIDVHLLEAGGRTEEVRSQSLYNAGMAGLVHTGTTEGRFRLFGGSSTRWGGQLLPYTPDVFAPPVGSPSMAWPIGPDAICQYYTQVEDLLGADHLPFGADIYRSFGRNIPEELSKSDTINLRASKWAPFARRNLALTLGEQAIASDKVTVFFHANVTELVLKQDGTRIESVLAQDYRGNQYRFEAEQYVLATGTIETSRLLLASRSVAPEGVGNEKDQVGRRFHDHVSYPAAELTGEARTKMLTWFAPILNQGTTHTAKLEASASLRERLNILAAMAHITIEEPEGSGADVIRGLLRSMQRGDLRGAIVNSLPRLPGASIEIARLAYNAKVRKRRAVSAAAKVTLRIDSEQKARSDNRVRIDIHEVDALGMPRTIVDWKVSEEELYSVRAFAVFLREEFARLGVGPIPWQPELQAEPSAPLTSVTDTFHPMGGTVMGVDPGRSVVDPDLRVHGVANLSVASCAAYPSGGSSNPTFTLMALTLRLAERLERDIAARL
jgi:choline dehydrogenase-like flavoprotein